ncbi:MAG: hypothetical protein ACI4L9_04145 [Candidatus Coproplasma sp.]
MKEIARKTEFKLVLYTDLIAGILCFLLAAVVTGLLIFYAVSGSLKTEDTAVTIVIFAIFYLICLGGGAWLVCRFVKWKKLPEILIYTDDEYLYFYTRKEVKLALKEIYSVFAGPESFLVHLFGGGYGTVEISANGSTYKVRFVDGASSIPDMLSDKIGLK